MQLDHETCYRALRSRDARFDGRFVTCVVTTGIYCRPICPARTPHKENVKFVPCSAAAEEAGYRPCRRCRPESSPGMADWDGTSVTVRKALRLITEGFLDNSSVEQLANRVGVGGRHLRRLFDQHVGASPTQIAHTRRLHFAKKLIDETNLPLSEVAFNAGFSSIRRFNSAFREAFDCAPTDLRRTAKQAPSDIDSVRLEFRLPYRPPFAWQHILDFLRTRAIPGVEAVSDNSYHRTFEVDGDIGTIEIRPSSRENELLLKLRVSEARRLFAIVQRVRDIFDLDSDPMRIQSALASHKAISIHAQATPGLRVPGCWDGFELAVRAILGQQVSVKAATTLSGRIAKAYGLKLPQRDDAELTTLFPSPQIVAAAKLEEHGVITSRANAIRHLAVAVSSGRLAFDHSLDHAELRTRLCEIPGIGVWTAEYICMRSARDPDAFPSSDLVLRKNASQDSKPISAKQLEALVEPLRPWRSYAALYLWSAS